MFMYAANWVKLYNTGFEYMSLNGTFIYIIQLDIKYFSLTLVVTVA
jgi:hypothetical protein